MRIVVIGKKLQARPAKKRTEAEDTFDKMRTKKCVG